MWVFSKKLKCLTKNLRKKTKRDEEYYAILDNYVKKMVTQEGLMIQVTVTGKVPSKIDNRYSMSLDLEPSIDRVKGIVTINTCQILG